MLYSLKMIHGPRFVRRFLGAVLLAAVGVLATAIVRYFVTSSLRDRKQTLSTAKVEVALKKVHYTEDADTGRKWELFAENGEYDKNADKTSLQDIRFIVRNEGKSGPVTVTARHGEYAHASKNVTLRENVVAQTADNASFSTQEVLYQASSRVLSGTHLVRLTDGALSVEGTGFDLDLNNGIARIHSNVNATIIPVRRK